MKKILNIITKNFKLLFRNKGSALIILLGPLFLILLIGTAFNTSSIYGIKIGVYATTYTPLAENLLQELGKKQFLVLKQSSQDECLEKLKAGDIHICSIFPNNLAINQESKIIFYVDPSRINLVYLVIEGISSKVETKSEEISLQLTKNILEIITTTRSTVTESRSYSSNINTASQQGLLTIQELESILNEQDFNLKENDFELDQMQEQAEALAAAHPNISINSLLGSIGRTKATLRQKIEELNQAAKLRDQATRILPGLQQTLNQQEEQATLLDNNLQTLETKLGTVAGTSAGKIVSPISTSIEPVIAKQTHLNYLFPTLIMIISLFMGILLSAILIIREKTGISYFRNYLSPTNETLFILGNYLTTVIIIHLQVFIVFAVAFYFFGKNLLHLLPPTLLIIFLFTTLFTLLGMIIGYLFKSEETSILAAISISSIALFFSNTILPLETLPTVLKNIANYNPFVIGENLLRKTMIFQTGITNLQEPIIITVTMIAIAFILVVITNQLSKKAARA
ncbi:MAG TPA: ABC transporter permease [Candidatus Nanoarchaeia archaeon]|nr:ABC transporter permease [Candidatus Nanoarchaeia archaeon]